MRIKAQAQLKLMSRKPSRMLKLYAWRRIRAAIRSAARAPAAAMPDDLALNHAVIAWRF
jgi:hypothetical protein